MTRDHVIRLFAGAEIHVQEAKLDDKKPLAQQGLDSLDMANLLFQMEQVYEFTIPPEDAARLRSIQDMAEYIGVHASAVAR